MFDLTGRTALVTGATGGIGGAIARAFHQQGATVALSGTRRDALDQLSGELKDRVHVLPCNLADKEEVEALVPKCEEAMGKLDILVANAGIAKDNLLVQLRDEDWDQVVAINLTATFRLARAAVRGMMRQRFGRELHRARVDRHGDDRQAQRQAAGDDPRPGARGQARRRGGCGGCRGLSRLARGRLYHRPNAARERRDGDDLSVVVEAPAGFPMRRRRAGQGI